jgi:hypothetical protein
MLRWLMLGALLCIASPVAAAPAEQSAPRVQTASRGLATLVSEFDVHDTALRDVIEQLRQLSGTNLIVNWPALEAAGVTPDQTITLRLQNVSVDRILRAVISLVGADVIGYGIDDGVVEITLRDIVQTRLVTRVYDIGDLLIGPADFSANAPSLNVTATTQRGGGAQSPFTGGGTNNHRREEERSERLEQFVELVTTVIDPDVWDVNGGRSRIFAFDRYLVITAPESTHRKLLNR